MRLSLIVAMARNGVIGRAGGLPWKLSDDLKRFKVLTMGHTIVMGRKTFESLGRVLPGRRMVVVSRQQLLQLPPDVQVVECLDESMRTATGDDEVFVIGGGEVFKLALPRAERMYVTWVEAEVAGDVFFPAVDWRQWREITQESHSADAKNEYDTTYCVYERVLVEGL